MGCESSFEGNFHLLVHFIVQKRGKEKKFVLHSLSLMKRKVRYIDNNVLEYLLLLTSTSPLRFWALINLLCTLVCPCQTFLLCLSFYFLQRSSLWERTRVSQHPLCDGAYPDGSQRCVLTRFCPVIFSNRGHHL